MEGAGLLPWGRRTDLTGAAGTIQRSPTDSRRVSVSWMIGRCCSEQVYQDGMSEGSELEAGLMMWLMEDVEELVMKKDEEEGQTRTKEIGDWECCRLSSLCSTPSGRRLCVDVGGGGEFVSKEVLCLRERVCHAWPPSFDTVEASHWAEWSTGNEDAWGTAWTEQWMHAHDYVNDPNASL